MEILSFVIALIMYAFGISPEVKTSSGKIQGNMSEIEGVPVQLFLGISYATPPVGSLRFLKPKPVEPWNNTLQAKKFPPACMQFTEGPYPWYDDKPGKSEDCLYLNIFAPYYATEGTKLAVLFWVHGGGYTLGSNRMDVYHAEALAKRGDVIVVTVNYRLGLFGFLTSNTDDAPGNMGLYDIVLALHWVNDNIEYFGGDKKKITMMGESGGASAISALCTSPLTKGLFSQVITESASIIKHKYNDLDSNLELTERLAEAVDCASENFTIYDHSTDVIQCLRDRNAKNLTLTLSSFFPLSTASFSPQYGNAILPNNAEEDIRNGNFHDASLLIGVNRDEGSFALTTSNAEVFGFFGEKDPKVNKTYARSLLQGTFSNLTDPERVINYYLGDVPDDDYDLIRRQVFTAMGDFSLLCPTLYFGESYADKKNDVYCYFFTHRPSTTVWAEWMGVAHFTECQFVFGQPLRKPKDYHKDEVWLSKEMIKVWSNFAKYGNPSETGSWPKYTNETHTYFTIDIKDYGKLGTGPHLESCNVLRGYYGF